LGAAHLHPPVGVRIRRAFTTYLEARDGAPSTGSRPPAFEIAGLYLPVPLSPVSDH